MIDEYLDELAKKAQNKEQESDQASSILKSQYSVQNLVLRESRKIVGGTSLPLNFENREALVENSLNTNKHNFKRCKELKMISRIC